MANATIEDLFIADKGKAFEILYKEYYGFFCNISYRYVRNKDAAEDVVQEVLTEMWHKSENIDISQSILAYCKRSIVNRSLNFIKAKSNNFLEEELIPEISSSNYNIQDYLEEEEVNQAIQDAIDTLPEGCRAVFLLSRMEELSNKEISDKLNISVKTVENQMTKALKRLREQIFVKN